MTDTWKPAAPSQNPLVTLSVLLIAIALCLVLGSSLMDIQRGNAALNDVIKQQSATVAASHKSEDQLNALARGLKDLSDKGNPNATMIVGALNRNGIHINPTAPTP